MSKAVSILVAVIIWWFPSPVGSQQVQPNTALVGDLEAILEADPENRSAMVKLGNHFFDTEDWKQAKTWYRRALELDPEDPNVLTDLAVAQRQLGEPWLSLDTLSKALALNPRQWQALYNKAVVLGFDLDRKQEALEVVAALENLRSEFPDMPDLNPLRVEFETKDPASAKHSPVDLEAAARTLIRHQVRPETLEEMYQQTTPLMVMMIENSIQTNIGRPITDLERFRLTVFCNQWIRELFTFPAMEDLLVPIVVSHLTLEDLEEINAFLSTPVGQKLSSIQAAIMREGQAAGERFGEQLADSDRAAEISEELKRQFPQWFSVDASRSVQPASATNREGVYSLWSTSKGDRIVVDGETYEGDSRLLRQSRTVYETIGETTCGDSVCIGYRMLVRETEAGGEETESEMFYYQITTSDSSCTWGVGWSPEERYSVGCTFRDIEGPIEPGKTWSFTDSLPGLERQFEMAPAVSYVGQIVATAVKGKVGDVVIEDCVEVLITGSSEPTQTITCVDGTDARVVSKKTNTRIYCPGMGPVREQNSETHWKQADPSTICTEYSSEYRTVSFETGG